MNLLGGGRGHKHSVGASKLFSQFLELGNCSADFLIKASYLLQRLLPAAIGWSNVAKARNTLKSFNQLLNLLHVATVLTRGLGDKFN